MTHGRVDVETVETARIDAECVEGVRELLAAARHVGGAALDGELGVLVDLLPRLVVAGDEPGHHERLRLRPRFGETSLDE